MNQKKITVTIGIPAYNEEANITHLLSALLTQEIDTLHLEKIVVSSDGSEDKTSEKVKALKNPLINLVDNKDRQGKGARQNQIVSLCQSDILVLIDADMAIKDQLFLEKLLTPIMAKNADLVSSNLDASPTKTFFEKIIVTGLYYKKNVYDDFRGGNNWYTCRGAARGFSKRLYRKIDFKRSVAEDLYTYLRCLSLGWKYQFVKNAKVFAKMPTNFADHYRQSVRYFRAYSVMTEGFDPNFIKENYAWPVNRFAIQGIKIFCKYPLYSILYPVVVLIIKLSLIWDKTAGTSDKWQVAHSSKSFRKI